MKECARADESPFFRAMVVMGSSLAVGCGGTTLNDPAHESGGGGSAARSVEQSAGGAETHIPGSMGSGGTSSTGGGTATPSQIDMPPPATTQVGIGDAGPAPTGGSQSNVPELEGTLPLGGDLAPDASRPLVQCPSEQWACAADQAMCDRDRIGWRYSSEECVCDLKRPRRANDCPAGSTFVCQAFTNGPEGGTYPFDCMCVPSATDCDDACRDTGYQGSLPIACASDLDTRGSYLCGCAIVSLR